MLTSLLLHASTMNFAILTTLPCAGEAFRTNGYNTGPRQLPLFFFRAYLCNSGPLLSSMSKCFWKLPSQPDVSTLGPVNPRASSELAAATLEPTGPRWSLTCLLASHSFDFAFDFHRSLRLNLVAVLPSWTLFLPIRHSIPSSGCCDYSSPRRGCSVYQPTNQPTHHHLPTHLPTYQPTNLPRHVSCSLCLPTSATPVCVDGSERSVFHESQTLKSHNRKHEEEAEGLAPSQYPSPQCPHHCVIAHVLVFFFFCSRSASRRRPRGHVSVTESVRVRPTGVTPATRVSEESCLFLEKHTKTVQHQKPLAPQGRAGLHDLFHKPSQWCLVHSMCGVTLTTFKKQLLPLCNLRLNLSIQLNSLIKNSLPWYHPKCSEVQILNSVHIAVWLLLFLCGYPSLFFLVLDFCSNRPLFIVLGPGGGEVMIGFANESVATSCCSLAGDRVSTKLEKRASHKKPDFNSRVGRKSFAEARNGGTT